MRKKGKESHAWNKLKEKDERIILFFFSSRRRHTRLVSDWSSDVCSSDLPGASIMPGVLQIEAMAQAAGILGMETLGLAGSGRSEERRVGKECRSRWSPYH